MRGINDSITHSLRALLARYSRTTCRVSLHCRLNVFCLFCAAKVRIFREETKNPRRLCGKKGFGEGDYRIRKGYSAGGATGVSSLVLQLPTSGAKLIVAPSLDKVKV